MIGHIPGIEPGAWFADRTALRASGIHRPPQAGICGTAAGGAESIVLAGGYVDDEDTGAEILYTGAGGNDRQTRRQTAHQTLGGPNAALVTSWQLGLPVRVVRGRPRANVLRDHPRVVFAPPETGYRYDGLYLVTDHWTDVGADGFRVLRFRLERLPTDMPLDGRVSEAPALFSATGRRESVVSHLIRDPAVVLHVKRLHGYCCQVCGRAVETPTGPYAEGAHIRPLGRPHDGPDEPENVLCLCPNHHVAFDRWAFALAADLSLVGLPGRLRTVRDHEPNLRHVAYHRARFEAAHAA
ncbi:MAG TPA: YDG/SRA domain-containing protein [Rubricoccaceae bacterium]